MADRVVKVRLVAEIAEFNKNMLSAANATRAVGTEAEKLAQTKQALNTLGATAVAFGAAVAVGVGVAINKYAEFDQAVSQVIATGEDAAKNQDALRQAALEAGAATVFSATESANAIEELAKAGLSAKDILGGGLNGALALAAAGGLGVAQAAGISATALQQFKLSGGQASHVADLLAAGAGKAMGDVTDLGMALQQTGLVANSTGLTIEETTAGLSAFASAGLLGSDAGTSFKSMLQRLTPQSKEAQAEMDRLGISAYDSQGKFIGLANFAGNLQDALHDLTPEQRNSALATIFGSDAVRAANVLYEEGASGIRQWTDEVNDQGYAARTAAARLDNLRGDIEKLSGSFDTLLINLGGAADGPLRGVVQTLTNMTDVLGAMPAPLQAVALGSAVVVAAIALVGGAALLAVPKVAEFRIALTTLGITGSSVKAGLGNLVGFLGGPWGAALTLATVAMGVFIGQQAEMASGAKSLQESLDSSTGAVTDYTREVIAKSLAEKDVFKTTTAAGISQGELVSALVKGGSAIDAVHDKLRAYTNSGHQFDITTTNAVNAVYDMSSQLQTAQHNFKDVKAATDDAADASENSVPSTKSAADAYLDAKNEAGGLLNTLNQLIDTVNKANGTNQDAVSSNAQYQAALAGVGVEIQKQRDEYEKANGTLDGFQSSLDANTVTGSANAAMLADVADKAQAAANAQYQVDQTTMGAKEATDKYAATLATQRQAFIDSAVQAGFNADEVQNLADKVFALPDAKQVQILAETAAAAQEFDDFINRISNRRVTIYADTALPAAGTVGAGRAGGGAIVGPGTSTSDSIPIRASTGEHMLDAEDVRRMGGQSGVYAFRRSLYGEGRSVPGYAQGGAVGDSKSASLPPVYVQNPFTGEYLLAQVDGRASVVAGATVKAAASPFRGGRRR